MFLAGNIRHLRKARELTQEELSSFVMINRGLIGSYEEGRAAPKIPTLAKLATFFGVTLDDLINLDLSVITPVYLKDRGLKVLSITLDQEGEENIEVVNEKAMAGYLSGYSDPSFISDLKRVRLPLPVSSGTHRAFEIQGESMTPLQPGSLVIGRFVDDIRDIKDGKTYVLVLKSEGIVYKRVFNYLDDRGLLTLVSDNRDYQPFNVEPTSILEIWETVAYFSVHIPGPVREGATGPMLKDILDLLRSVSGDLRELKSRND